MQIKPNHITGLILAGGQGRRMNNQDKGLVCYQGKPLIEHQLDWLKKQVNNILISANRNISTYENLGVTVLSDLDPGVNAEFSGPLTGLQKGLSACTTKWLFVQPVDVPSLPLNLINLLCKKTNDQQRAYFLKSKEREHFLSMLIAKESLPELNLYLQKGGRRVRDFLTSVDAKSIDLGISEVCFQNLNKPSDF